MAPPHTMAVKEAALRSGERGGELDLRLSMRCAICSIVREVTQVSSEVPVGQQASSCVKALVEGGCSVEGCWAINVTARLACGEAHCWGVTAGLRSPLSAA